MSAWVWTLIAIGILLAIGAWTDWRRRYSTGGNGDTPLKHAVPLMRVAIRSAAEEDTAASKGRTP